MIASIINALAVIFGSIVGRLVGGRIGTQMRNVVFAGIGVASFLIGVSMALQSQRFLYLVLSLVIGGLIGTALHLEDRVYRLGEWLKARFAGSDGDGTAGVHSDHGSDEAGATAPSVSTHSFAQGFLVSSVLFCVGALAIIGSFQAGVEKNYELLLTKSVMDGFMAVLLTAAYGIGVGFSALPILVYQGALTLLAGVLSPFVSALMVSEISGVGGAMVVMIGLNLLELKTIKTADFLPGLVVVIGFVLADPFLSRFI
jgi:uncharacterized membrane protein YqgA involved in biofilm formation